MVLSEDKAKIADFCLSGAKVWVFAIEVHVEALLFVYSRQNMPPTL